MESNNIGTRLKSFIDERGMTSSQFADLCGIARPSLSQLLTGRNKKISDLLVGQIHRVFPELSVVWLMFGEGSRYVSSSTNDDELLQKQADASIGSPSLFDADIFSSNDTEMNKYSNLSDLKSVKNEVKTRDNYIVEETNKVLELQREIEKIRQNPRKVSHITIYYDDSTFETFYPSPGVR